MEDIEKILDTKYDQLWKEVTFKLKALAWLKEQCGNTEYAHVFYYDNASNIDTIAKMYLNYKLMHSELELPANWIVTVFHDYVQVDCNAYMPATLKTNSAD
jgi:hypothetical protein